MKPCNVCWNKQYCNDEMEARCSQKCLFELEISVKEESRESSRNLDYMYKIHEFPEIMTLQSSCLKIIR